MISGYDIIGDVHGQHLKLEALLRKLGYREHDGAWRCAGRQAIFVGDLIDRGPGQVETVWLVRRMMDAGAARCIMGNHEFNAVAWFTPDPLNPGEFLRPHHEKNLGQHAEFLEQVSNPGTHADFISWFRTLPLWLEEPGIRIVHACWHVPSLQWLEPRLDADGLLPLELYEQGSRRGQPAFNAIEAVCKGLEVSLPDGISFVDKGGVERHEARIRWWLPELATYQQAAIGPPDLTVRIPDLPFPDELRPEPYHGPPVFFGHYWFTGEPHVLADNAACVDYSAGKGGPLVAYRWDGESKLKSEKLVAAG